MCGVNSWDWKYTKKTVHILVFSVLFLRELWGRSGLFTQEISALSFSIYISSSILKRIKLLNRHKMPRIPSGWLVKNVE